MDKTISYNLSSEGDIKISNNTTEIQDTGFELSALEGTCFSHWHPRKKAAEKNISIRHILYALAVKVQAKECKHLTNNGYLLITDLKSHINMYIMAKTNLSRNYPNGFAKLPS